MFGHHLGPFPNLGRIAKCGDAWQWQPIEGYEEQDNHDPISTRLTWTKYRSITPKRRARTSPGHPPRHHRLPCRVSAPLIPILAQQAHVYALDLRGHNLSGRTPGAYQVQDYGRDVGGLSANRSSAGRPSWPAIPWAAWLPSGWPRPAPDWVRGIFLEDPPLYITQPPRFQETLFYGYLHGFLRDYLRQHHANGGTLDDMIAFVGQLPVNEKQTHAGSRSGRRQCGCAPSSSSAWTRPSSTRPSMASSWAAHEPDDLLAQMRCPIHLLAAQAEFGGAMDAQDVQRFVSHAPALHPYGARGCRARDS